MCSTDNKQPLFLRTCLLDLNGAVLQKIWFILTLPILPKSRLEFTLQTRGKGLDNNHNITEQRFVCQDTWQHEAITMDTKSNASTAS